MLFKKKKKEEIDDGLDFSPWPNMTEPETYMYRGQELTHEQWEHLLHGPRGSRLAEDNPWLGASGSFYEDPYHGFTYNSTGTVPQPSLHLDNPRSHNLEFDVEALWEKMYEHAMAVIVVCEWCGTPQAIANGTCMRCGGTLPKPKPLGR